MTAVDTNELIASREQFFNPIDLRANGYNCGDDQTSDWQLYAHIFGGATFLGYSTMILGHINEPIAVESLESSTASAIRQLASRGYQHQGVHSSVSAEGGHYFQTQRTEGGLGCGYIALRRDISQLISEQGESILAEMDQLLPHLFADEGKNFARQVVAAHGYFATNPTVLGQPRQIALSAIREGATPMLVDGGHTATDGIINLESGTTFDNNSSVAAGLPTYDHDLWASNDLLAQLPATTNYSHDQLTTASLVDIIGTMRALGVTQIAVR